MASDIDFRLERGARHALIGPNGAGKTSFVNLVTGALRADGGRILLDGADITHCRRPRGSSAGSPAPSRSPRCSGGLSVLENVTPGGLRALGMAGDLFRPAGHHRVVIEEAYALLERLGLADDALRPVKELAYGRQRLVEIAVALGLKPKVLLLDEPAAGVPSGESGVIIETIERLPPDIAVLIIEHDMDLVFRLANASPCWCRARAGRGHAAGDRRRCARAPGLSRRARPA